MYCAGGPEWMMDNNSQVTHYPFYIIHYSFDS